MILCTKSDENILIYAYDKCYTRNSTIAEHLCSKNRGCCLYSPKCTLFDLQRMVRSTNGKLLIKRLLEDKKSISNKALLIQLITKRA